MVLEQLEAPPIVEVVCGVTFESIPQLDPLSIGWYSLARAQDYPTHQIQPPITDQGMIFVGPITPVRAWLISPNSEFLVQIQHDRFFLNWRAGASDYPRFNEHDGRPGILQRFLIELQLFGDFCSQHFGITPRVRRTELAKVDHVASGAHWNDIADLGKVLPSMIPLLNLSTDAQPSAAFNVSSRTPLGQLQLSVTMQQRTIAEGKTGEVVIVESRSSGDLADAELDIRSEMIARNDQLNEVFEALIPKEERQKRFRRDGK